MHESETPFHQFLCTPLLHDTRKEKSKYSKTLSFPKNLGLHTRDLVPTFYPKNGSQNPICCTFEEILTKRIDR